MAHFAEIDKNNVVLRVIVVNNNELLDENGVEQEAKGIAFCKTLFGNDTNWVQTSYNGNFKKSYAGVGFTYDEVKDAFIGPQPYPSWLLDENTCSWNPPISYPQDGNQYYWDEDQKNWVEVSKI